MKFFKLESLFKDHFGKLTATTAEELEVMPYKMPVLYMNQLNIARFFTQATKDFIHSVQDHTITHINFLAINLQIQSNIIKDR